MHGADLNAKDLRGQGTRKWAQIGGKRDIIELIQKETTGDTGTGFNTTFSQGIQGRDLSSSISTPFSSSMTSYAAQRPTVDLAVEVTSDELHALRW